MTSHRYAAPLLVVAALVVAACHKSETDLDVPDVNTAEATPPPAAVPTVAPMSQIRPAVVPPGVSTTAIVPAAALSAITLPAPHDAPAGGKWVNAAPVVDGKRTANYRVGNADMVNLRIVDCNLPAAKEATKQPASQWGDFSFCIEQGPVKIGGFDAFAPGPSLRAIRVGHLALVVSVGIQGTGRITAADLEGVLTALDPAALARR